MIFEFLFPLRIDLIMNMVSEFMKQFNPIVLVHDPTTLDGKMVPVVHGIPTRLLQVFQTGVIVGDPPIERP